MAPLHDKLFSATIFSKILRTFVDNKVPNPVQVYMPRPVYCDLIL